jgi:mRNA-degrading endonuclease toxin of MazEF toxin-antitoxin module
VRRGEIRALSGTDAIVVVGSDRLHGNDFPITYGLPIHAEPARGLDYPLVVRLSPTASGLSVESWVHAYALRSVRSSDLGVRLGVDDDRAADVIDEALRTLLQL